MIPLPVHPLLRRYVPTGRTLYLCCDTKGLASTWAFIHGIEPDGWRWLNPVRLSKFPKKKAEYAVMIGDARKALLDAVREAGLKPVSGEGFLY